MARRCGLDRSYFSLLERGSRGANLTTIFKVAEAFGVQPSTLLRKFERPRP
jgi:transcriptional regulator with XRE-family HTH domain